MKVTCEIRDYSQPRMPHIRIHNGWQRGMVEVEADEKRYTVSGTELIKAVINAMNNDNNDE